jgi:hypothetical protein
VIDNVANEDPSLFNISDLVKFLQLGKGEFRGVNLHHLSGNRLRLIRETSVSMIIWLTSHVSTTVSTSATTVVLSLILIVVTTLAIVLHATLISIATVIIGALLIRLLRHRRREIATKNGTEKLLGLSVLTALLLLFLFFL